MIALRRPQEGDATAIAQLINQLGYATSTEEVARRLERFAGNPAACVRVAVDGDIVIGVGALHFIDVLEGDQPLAALIVLVVEHGHRGRGVGTALVRDLEREARARGSFAISVHSGEKRVGAHAFYRQLGYELTGERIRKLLHPAPSE